MNPCPKCGVDDDLTVYTYDNGWRHVECLKCNYLGPGEGSIKAAIKSHNAKSVVNIHNRDGAE
jgi:uncharacterized metal-binding protein (TIGR02443 family)